MNYKQLFITRELEELNGKGNRNLTIACILLVISLLSISVSLGVYNSLKERMDNPYTNWVTMPVLYKYKESIPSLINQFQSQAFLDSFNLLNLNTYVKDANKMIFKNGEEKTYYGRSINFEENIVQKIFEKDNVLALRNDDEKETKDLFAYYVSEAFCEQNKLNPVDLVNSNLAVLEQTLNTEDYKVYLFPVKAVLKSLPNHSDFIISEELCNLYRKSPAETGFIPVENQTRIVFLSESKIENELLKQAMPDLDIVDVVEDTVTLYGKTTNFSYKVFTSSFISDSVKNIYISKLSQHNKSIKIINEWAPVTQYKNIENPMYVSFNFKNLDKIRNLQTYLKNNYGMEIEVSVVDERENFSMVSRLTYFMIFSIILISIICFSIFLFNLIKNHLESIKANIGTLMAFGLSTRDIQSIYLITIQKFMLMAWIYALAALAICYFLCLFILNFRMDILNLVNLITALIFTLLSFYITKISLKKLLNESPGDLIYNRV
ncbi:MAG: hypothetical protein IPK46_08795 [Saprospiraceae bacterium]|nr:hypothetical protein [Saprospiraceae bacterium]